ncbi:hypothetical protein PFICI_00719 [Pestalotiopsis fici W106-1]|uniref:Ketoreductase domain-containing protein n=1 Tax=Pestalotiopsis fici (strain W106-1 / CGMCC3.15140) TaxID=1229662 RepID=W3XNQ2_PESFW|nr:uncharacterized protein PFICI_00719 [Pestalotiopsis fici W106-1]ETS86891.1 hypothetical protein PFICI_00719 [Pestalotiopsis fici W106-1]
MTKGERQYPIAPSITALLLRWTHSQLFRTPAYPTQSFAGQTIIVTGSNIGLGLEASRHFYRLGCARLILAVRSTAKGEAAKEDILASVTARTDGDTAVEVWELDMSSTASILKFAERVRQDIDRLDVLVLGAGVSLRSWSTVQDVDGVWETVVQVNVINTFLLALELLPKLRGGGRSEDAGGENRHVPRLVVVSSEAHRLTKFVEIEEDDIYATLSQEKHYNVNDRYAVTKLMEVLFVRELVARLRAVDGSHPPVIINLVNPGTCISALNRYINPPLAGRIGIKVLEVLFMRTTEVGGRTYVYSAAAGPEYHGEFMSDGELQHVESWIYTDVGKKTQ